MLLVGHVAGRTAILIDDLADTSNTITRAAKLLKKEGAVKVYALVTHGVLSGDAIERINASALDKVVVTNSVPQDEHLRNCPKLEVLEVGNVFAEVSLVFPPPNDNVRGLADAATGNTESAPWREYKCVVSVRLMQSEDWTRYHGVTV